MPSHKTVYQVRSFHLNIDEGDSAVHYRLVQYADDQESNIVDRAVMVDGGLGATGTEAVQGFLKQICTSDQIQCQSSRKQNQMDAFVVTHWDKDHVAGLENTFKEDLEHKFEVWLDGYLKKNKKKDINSMHIQKLINQEIPEELYSSYVLYGEDGLPLTHLWCPYWDVRESKTSPTPEAIPSRKLDKWSKFGSCFVRLRVEADALFSGTYTVCIPILRIPYAGRDLLGRDLWDGSLVMTPQMATSPRVVAASLKKPALFCVAADFGTCDPDGEPDRLNMIWDDSALDKLKLVKTSSNAPRSIIQDHSMTPQSIDGPTTSNNQASVACMIIWPTDPKYEARISHYFAGDIGARENDMTKDIEERILRWATEPQDNMTRIPVVVEQMKLSHHGGKYSTPIRMLFAWKPYHIIGSNGMRKSYNHCSWETIMIVYIYTYWINNLAGVEKRAPPLLCTNLPIYLVNFQNDQGKLTYVGPGSVASLTSKAGGSFRSLFLAIQELVNKRNGPKIIEDLPKDRPKQQICWRIAEYWDTFSYIPMKCYSSNNQITQSMMHATEQNVRYIKLTHFHDYAIRADPILGRTMALTDPDHWNPDHDVDEESISTRRLINQPLSQSRECHKIYEDRPINRIFQRDDDGENRRKRPMIPMCTETAFEYLTLDNDVVDNSDDLGEANDKISLEPCLRIASEWQIIPRDQGIHVLDDVVYLVASDAVKKDTSVVVKSYQVLRNSNLDCFLGHLSAASMALKTAPSNKTKIIPLDDSDEWLQWILQIFGDPACQISANVSITDNVVNIHSMTYGTQLGAAFADKSKIPAVDLEFFRRPVVFDSARNHDAFGVPNGIWPADPNDIAGPAQILCLSLKEWESAPHEVSVAGLLAFADMKASKVSKVLGSNLFLSLDTSDGQRNVLWFDPDASYTTTLRLAFSPIATGLSEAVVDFIGKMIDNPKLGDSIKSAASVQLVVRKRWRRAKEMVHNNVTITSVLTLVGDFQLNISGGTKKVSVQIALAFEGAAIRWIISFGAEGNGESIADIVNAICALFNITPGPEELDLKRYLPGADHIILRRIDYTSQTARKRTTASLVIIIQVNFAGLVFLCTLTINLNGKSKFNICGSLFPENRSDLGRPLMTWLKYMPEHEPWTALNPISKHGNALDSPSNYISDMGNLQSLYQAFNRAVSPNDRLRLGLSGTEVLPPAPIEFQLVKIDFAVDSESLHFTAVVGSKEPDKSTKELYAVPVIRLMTAMLRLNVNWSTNALDELSVSTRTMLTSPKTDERVLVNLLLGYYQTKSEWILSGGVLGMSGSFIYSLFDDDCNLEMVELLQHLTLSFDVTYVYNTKGVGSSFKLNGLLHIGSFDMDFTYQHNGRPTAKTVGADPVWSFQASLANQSKSGNNLFSLINALCGGDFSSALPGFLKDSKFSLNENSKLTQMKVLDTGKELLFVMRLQLTDGSSIAFYQIQTKRKNIKSMEVAPTKRILMFSLDKLPQVPKIPIIGQLGQPFDELQFFWVSASDPQSTGLTRGDIALVNEQLPEGFASLVFRDLKKKDNTRETELSETEISLFSRGSKSFSDLSNPYMQNSDQRLVRIADPDDSAVALTSGFHFCLMNNRKLILDYAFGGKKKSSSDVKVDENVNGNEGEPTSAPLEKKLGPVSISAISLDFDMNKQILTLQLTGTLKLGPLELSLIGFGVSFPLKHLKGGEFPVPSFSLRGLAIAFERNPLTIAGMFAYGPIPPDGYYYKGAAAIGFVPWLFEGGGYYGVSKKSGVPKLISSMGTFDDTEWAIIDPYALEHLLAEVQANDVDLLHDGTFKSFFAFARLSGPMATVGYAEIRDVCGGFGYNTTIAFPTMQNILEFPFFKSPGDDGVAGALTKFLDSGWVVNSEGTNWAAAGLTINAFQTLTVTAVVVIEFGVSVKLGIFGIATAEIPKPLAGAKDSVKFAVVQLGVAATYDFNAGVLKVDGQLTPASFILDPSCHLTGGFALYAWLGEGTKELRGDWVFTIGGFHPAYRAPTQYPNPPRLGISWSYDSSINITGQSYFAITPKVCMGGGSLHITLTLGTLYAFLDAWADFLINYRPFQYQASGGVRVGVRYTLDLWLVSIPINIEIGADIYLQGPPLSGRVHVNFYVFGFDVNFGEQGVRVAALVGWDEFYKLALQAGSAKPSSVFKIEEEENDSERVEADELDSLPAHVISCVDGLIPGLDDKSKSQSGNSKWVVRAAGFAFSVSSKFPINTAKVVTVKDDKTSDVTNPVGQGQIFSSPMGLGLNSPIEESEMTISIQPTALPRTNELRALAMNTWWDNNQAQTGNLPNALWAPYNPHDDLLNGDSKGATTELMTGVKLVAPTGGSSDDKLAVFKPEKAMLEIAETVKFPTLDDQNAAWAPAKPQPSSKEQFALVKEAWDGSAARAAEAAAFWSQLPWNAGAADWKDIDRVASQPEMLAKSLDRYCIEAPLVSVA